MKVLVFGNGWLGNLFSRKFDVAVTGVDIFDSDNVISELRTYMPDVVVNTAAKCGRPNIDWCEATPESRKLTWYVNALGPAFLYSIVKGFDAKIKFVHLSSGCLWYDGRGLRENARKTPPSWYSTTKLIGEEKLESAINDGALILRLRMPIDWQPHPRNYITKLASFPKVVSLPNSYTIVDDMLDALSFLLEKDASGIFHVVNGGAMNAEEILSYYCKYVDKSHTWQRVMMEELMASGLIKAQRSNCVISNQKLRDVGFKILPLRQRLKDIIVRYAEKKK